MSHWVGKYIGEEWTQENDCWAFFRRVQREQYGRELPPIDIDSLNLRQILGTFEAHPERRLWHQTETPQDGDGVLMGRNDHPIHVGIWVLVMGGRVLHCEQKAGVVLQDMTSLKMHLWNNIRFYRYAGRHAD